MAKEATKANQDLKDISAHIEPIIRKAGALLLSYRNKQLRRIYKDDGDGFVTQADLACEEYLKEALRGVIPEASILAEETGSSGKGDDLCWVIDPLDGTTNFAYGMSHFCISVALTKNGVPIIGCIYQPITDELFCAIRAGGARCNGELLRIGEVDADRALVGHSFDSSHPDFSRHISGLARTVWGVRDLGAAALDLAYVAAGRLDGFASQGLYWWDIAAGSLLVQEAGGAACDRAGIAVNCTSSYCFAGSRALMTTLRRNFVE